MFSLTHENLLNDITLESMRKPLTHSCRKYSNNRASLPKDFRMIAFRRNVSVLKTRNISPRSKFEDSRAYMLLLRLMMMVMTITTMIIMMMLVVMVLCNW